ncbi:MAG TPA: Hsp20/alpha crystallin family protein [Candidatus Eisenbacteria bacterium]|nr:Hsp20/alpha crystallin family protein [Candidatus Eisenbacteria bacterium]
MSQKAAALENPPANIYESAGQVTVAIPLPGTHAENVEVLLRKDRLSVQAEARYPQAQQHYLQHEWQVGTFQREVRLPRSVHAEGAKALLSHGVLTVSLHEGDWTGPAEVQLSVAEIAGH